jgi:hypothetical protein
MQRPSAQLVVPVLALLLLLVLAGILGRTDRAPSRLATRPSSVPPARYLGMTSCATAGCHHGNGAPGAPRSEFSTYEALDTHAQAFGTLRTERSRLMVRLAYGDEAALPEKQPLCLTCHDTARSNGASSGTRFTVGEGVGCESCHGAAERWREPHSRPDWRERGVEQKVALGMQPLWDPGARARLCARCHVGSEDATISHDLIAAGHPALFFEVVAFMIRLPRHWQQDRGGDGRPLGADELWAAGQVEAERAALLALARQARDQAAPWPEFAQMECASCHHDLKASGWRRRGNKPQTVSPFVPGEWYTATLEVLLANQPADVASRLPPVVKELHQLERELARGSPNRRHVAVLADDLVAMLPRRFVLPSGPTALVVRLARPEVGEPLTWGSAAQRYLAIRALSGSLWGAGGEQGRRLSTLLRRLQEALGDPSPAGGWEALGGSRGFNPNLALYALDDVALWATHR